MRRMVWSSADKNVERSRGAKDLGPPVTSPDERRSVIRLRTARVIPIDCSVNGFPFGGDHLRTGLYAATCERDIRRDHNVAFAGALRDPVVGRIHAGTGRYPLDRRILGYSNETTGHDTDRQAVAGCDAVDLFLDGTGVGVDIDPGVAQECSAVERDRKRKLRR